MIAAKSNVMFDHCLLGLQVVLHSQFSFENVEIMYQSNRSLNILPPSPQQVYPGHLMSFLARDGGNLMNLVFPGTGYLITTHRGLPGGMF